MNEETPTPVTDTPPEAHPTPPSAAHTPPSKREEVTKTVVVRPGELIESLGENAASANRGPAEDYAICGKIGDGGMGIVYLARDRRLGRYVAIKRLNDKALADPVLRQRFLHEARAVAALNHSHIVHIYALGEDSLGPYIVMEYVAGPEQQTELVRTPEDAPLPPPKGLTLEQYIHQHGPMTADEAVSMMLKIARTMVYAHSCGVIHRDLKPANILLDPSYEPKLVDFGLARLMPKEAEEPVVEGLTVPGEKLISLGYSAPELEQDASTSDARADIYSLGAILYFLLTGRNPRYYREQDVPTFLREVLRRSMETEREQRYRSAQDFVRALTEAASHGKVVAPTIKMTWRCKWCDAVNPVSTKFCAECGWDGCEHCLECNAETFIGQQYCPSCGADRRMYEHVASIIAMMNQAWEERRYERIPSIVGRLHGFEPAGQTGRKLLSDAKRKVEEAERYVARRDRLSALIPAELKAENYERAKVFIEEFRTLNEDPLVYEEELKNIPRLIFERDLVRIRQYLRADDWTSAQHLAASISAQFIESVEYRDIRRQLVAHQRRRERLYWGFAFAGVFLLYVISLPLIAGLGKGHIGSITQTLYMPAQWVYAIPGLHWFGNHYARWVGLESIDRLFPIDERTQIRIAHSKLPIEAQEVQNAFNAELLALEEQRRTAKITQASRYRLLLSDMRQRLQEAGNYDGVLACDRALNDFNATQTVSQPQDSDVPELIQTKLHFLKMGYEQELRSARQIEQLVTRYIQQQDEFRKVYTQQGDMDVAGEINKELNRVRELPILISATTLLSTAPATEGSTQASGFTRDEDVRRLAAIFRQLQSDIAEEQTRFKNQQQQLQQNYLIALDELWESFQQSGDFDACTAIDAAKQKIKSTSILTQTDVVTTPKALRQLQLNTLSKLNTANEDSMDIKRTLYMASEQTLENWKSNLTKNGEMEAAAAVNEGLIGMRGSESYRHVFGLELPEPTPPPTLTPTPPPMRQPLPQPTAPNTLPPPSR